MTFRTDSTFRTDRPRELSPSIVLFASLTPTLPPATHTNSYAIGSREVLLVEPATPYPDEQRAWIAWARSLPSAGRTPVAIFLTHHHPDHVGGAEVLSRELGLPVWAHTDAERRVPVPLGRRLDEGDALVLDGPEPECWTVLHTPGHAPDHLCLFEARQRVLLVGDMVASVGTILIAPGDGDMRVYLEQLDRLAQKGARLALPAHGEPISDPVELFRRYIAHRLMREAKVLAALRARSLGGTADEILPQAYDDVPPAALPLGRLSMLSHLQKLESEGRVRVSHDEPEPRYIAVLG